MRSQGALLAPITPVTATPVTVNSGGWRRRWRDRDRRHREGVRHPSDLAIEMKGRTARIAEADVYGDFENGA